ncbi:hypothetical protein Ahy_A09g045738 [Arachis hypogaea]|uniref:Pentatricopeptide repeat-containing protein n=1 Tax=Arachis hypogaea TaxID=3818 RepID=A0A445BN40_ARAHY|nr:hypothetical protein Ahy_A09g045738 [Arachis hypogaea]
MGSGALGHEKGAHCQIIHVGFHYYRHVENALMRSMGLRKRQFLFLKRLEMINQGVNPDEVTYLGILSSCWHADLVKEGQDYLNSMIEHGMEPEMDHYSCIVDLLGQAGLLLEACDFIRNMPICPNAVIWGSLLSSSMLHGDVWIGIEAAESSRNQVARVQKSLKDKGLKSNPGCSWIEVKSRVHRFEAQDKSNNKMTDILLIMGNLNEHMNSLGL